MKIINFIIICLTLTTLLCAQNKQIDEDKLKTAIEKDGGLKFKKEIFLNPLKDKRYQDYLISDFNKKTNLDLIKKEEMFLHLMGYSSRKIDLLSLKMKIYGKNVKALFQKDLDEIYAREDILEDNYLNKMYISFVLRQALWNQYSTIFKDKNYLLSDFDDRKIAILCTIYGDCTYTMLKIADFDPKLFRGTEYSQALVSYLPTSNLNSLYSLPESIKNIFLSPYFQGLDFVTYIYKVKSKKKKIKRMAKLFKELPVSTSQILHPEKYLDGQFPIPVLINYKPQNHEEYHSGVVGEYLLTVLFNVQGVKNQSLPSWQGDKFNIHIKEKNQYFFIYKSMWNTIKDCEQIYKAMRIFLSNNFKIKFRKDDQDRFIAGRIKDDYFFLSKVKEYMILVRTNQRNEINTFINGGNYD